MTEKCCAPEKLASDPDALSALVQAGTAALSDGDLRIALDNFRQVVAAFPDRPEGHNNLGALYSALGDLEPAEACFSRVVELLPENPHVLYNRGVVRTRREDLDGARLDFEAAAALAPDDPAIHNNLGVTAYLQTRPDGARKHFEQALRLRPDYDQALLNLCDLDAEAGELNQAITTCDEYLRRHQSTAVRRKLFELHRTAGLAHLDRAAGTAETLLVTDPDDADLRRELGCIIQARGALFPPTTEAEAAG